MRRVNTHVGTSLYRDSFNSSFKMNKADINQKFSCPDFIKADLGLEMPEPKKESFGRRFANLMDIGLLKDGIYLNLLFGLSIFYVAEMNFKMVTPFFLASLGYTKAETAYCLSVSALTDILARIIVPPICDKTKVSKRLVFMVSILFVAITRSSECMQILSSKVLSLQTDIISLIFSLSWTNRTIVDDGLALYRRVFSWHRIEQFHFNSQRVFIARETSSSVWLAHGRKSNFCHNFRTVYWIHSWLNRLIPHLYTLTECLHLNMHFGMVDWVHHEVHEAKREKANSNCNYIIISMMIDGNIYDAKSLWHAARIHSFFFA